MHETIHRWIPRILLAAGIAAIVIGSWTMGALWAVDEMIEAYGEPCSIRAPHEYEA